MRAVGEVMSIGKNYKESLQKAIRSLETGRHGLGFAKDFNTRSLDELLAMLKEPTSERHFIMYEALRKGATTEALYARTHIKPWFIEQMRELVELEEEILRLPGGRRAGRRAPAPTAPLCPTTCSCGPRRTASPTPTWPSSSAFPRLGSARSALALGLTHGYHPVPVSGVENAAYYYSTYNAPDTVPVSDRRKIMVLGGGPNRIGQGIEFDYCCVHAAFALRDAGFESIMVNCNPETVSTDYDTSDKLYFEPLTVEDVLAIYEKERPEGVIVQFGGQTPLNLARELEKAGRAHHRHLAGHHRPGRRPRPLPGHDATSRHPHARGGDGHHLWTRPGR